MVKINKETVQFSSKMYSKCKRAKIFLLENESSYYSLSVPGKNS